MSPRPANVSQIDYAGWFIGMLTWDGLLPLSILVVPPIAEAAIPNRGVLEFLAVTLPIAFFFWRIVAGCRRIDANHCSARFQKLQVWSLVLAVFLLVFLDALTILLQALPKGAFNREDFIVLGVMLVIYLIPMAIAMYPGRSQPLPVVWMPDEV